MQPQPPLQDSPQSSSWLQDLMTMKWLRQSQSAKRASSRVHRHTEAMLAKRYDNLKPELDEKDMGDSIRFNSPETHIHLPEKSKGLGTLAKLAIGAGLLGTGVGAGVGVPLIIDALSSEVTAPTSAETITNTIDWKIGKPIVE